MTRLVFQAAIAVSGIIANRAIVIAEHKGWLGLSPVNAPYAEDRHSSLAKKACGEINALLHAGIPLAALAAAARTSRSNHAEILRAAADAVQAQHASLASFGLSP